MVRGRCCRFVTRGDTMRPVSFLPLAATRIIVIKEGATLPRGARGKGTCAMRKVLVAVVAVISVLSLSACADDWIGKGKGKAPPPAAEPAPIYK
jgi:hypothetical protein